MASSNTCRGLVIAGPYSGVGKTTVTLGLIAAFRRRGLKVQPFKVGPDFIDPGHHTQAAGVVSRNLDGWILPQEANHVIFRLHALRADLALVEGVMGLFDGYDGASEAGSTAQMAKWLGLPVLLVVDTRAMARSAGALVHGFAHFDPDLTLAGVVFNRVGSATHRRYLEQALGLKKDAVCLGAIPREQELAIPERHLGLTTAQEHPLTPAYLDRLADLMEQNLDLDALWERLPVLNLAVPPLTATGDEQAGAPDPHFHKDASVRLGVARDEAFCFYYPENLEWLEHFGAEIVPFSPLHDRDLPPGLHGLYLGGGYPELFAGQLAENRGLLKSLKYQAEAGMPIYAECGGLMFLSQEIQDLDGNSHAMAGVLPLRVRMLPRLRALGYREITLAADGLLGPRGTRARGHEFHYSEIISEPNGVGRVYRLTDRNGETSRLEGYTRNHVLASYVHLHFSSNPEAARNLVEHCRCYKESNENREGKNLFTKMPRHQGTQRNHLCRPGFQDDK
jgi:cobyrinic acid a,c-diamide synthase